MQSSRSGASDSKQILNKLKELEERISRLEQEASRPAETRAARPAAPVQVVAQSQENLEFTIGEFWLAKVGIVILAIGIAFLLTFPYKNLPAAVPGLFGYVLVGGIVVLSWYLRNTFAFVSRYLLGGGLVLLYFSTLRLAFFSPHPVVTGRSLVVALLLIVVAINLYVSARRKSIYLMSVNISLGYITAIISEQPLLLFSLVLILSALAVYFKLKYEWHNFIIWPIILTYLTHLVWFLNNPFMGHEVALVKTEAYNIFFLLAYSAVFALGNLLREKDLPENDVLITSTFLNCLFAYGLFLLIGLTAMETGRAIAQLVAGGVFITIAVLFWVRERSRYSTFFFSMFGFGALSMAIILQSRQPDVFVWLSWQSLLVIAAALWFRSKIIVFTNFTIFLLIFLAYLASAPEANVVSLSFGIVAMLSARIMNWQKHRLEIKTELMRNTYLVSAFIAFPYALYHAVPQGYVGLSWLGISIFYYLLSILLKNIKYRWMALGTLLVTVLYVLVFGIGGLEPVYRIVSFIVVGTVLLLISIAYSRTKKKSGSGQGPLTSSN